jgi:hypothetical protein
MSLVVVQGMDETTTKSRPDRCHNSQNLPPPVPQQKLFRFACCFGTPELAARLFGYSWRKLRHFDRYY